MLFLRRNYHRPKPQPPRSQVIATRILIALGIALILVAGYCIGPGSRYGVYHP